MNIVIMGGGKVGESLARRILENRHEVKLIEVSRERSYKLANELDLSLIHIYPICSAVYNEKDLSADKYSGRF